MSINYHAEVARKKEKAAITRKKDTTLSCVEAGWAGSKAKADTEACEATIDSRWDEVAESAPTTPFRLMDLPQELCDMILYSAIVQPYPIYLSRAYPERRKEPALLSVSRYLRARFLPIWYGRNVFTFRYDGPRGLEWWCRKIGKEKRSMLTGVEVHHDTAGVAMVRETLRRRYRLVFRDGVLQALSDASTNWQLYPRYA
ncbi:hypothetical protein B0A49_11759 [Cryomyces minteri]|uniref:F-box domain-containing protein n=1 Tax=Cryomyces minteri TaxID=331657 RepID=A0A4U0WCR5_9PEZI|nr:hypothetical protein B0A49_11759 [Cryomyces minteri]